MKYNNQKQLDIAIQILKLLTHAERLEIILILTKHGQLNVSTMQSELEIKQSMISHHLAKMKRAGIVKSQRVGQENHYSLGNSTWVDILTLLIEREYLPG